MNTSVALTPINGIGIKIALQKPLLWGVFLLFVILAGYTMAHHEPWGDEIHSWNIAKGSGSFWDLIHNTRYEGHPPVWYTIMWPISKFTHNYTYVQAAHIMIASATVFLLLFFSSFPLITRILMPFGYFFLYEYAVLSRNYAIGVFLVMCVCVIMRRHFRYKLVLYYILLFLLSNTHLLAMLLAGSLHLYFLLMDWEEKRDMRSVLTHILIGGAVLLPSLYFIFPPSDSHLNTQFWIDRWNYHNITAFVQGPLRSFLPVAAWWVFNSWHTQFLLDAKEVHPIFKVIDPLVAILLPVLAFFVLKNNRKSLILFAANFLLSFIVAIVVFPLTSARYAGFIYIGFIASFWLYCCETPVSPRKLWLVSSLLVIHLAGSIVSIVRDVRYPFSNFNRVKELINEVPASEKVVVDYWGLNAIAAFMDRPFYCLDLKKEVSFLLWDSNMASISKTHYRYTEGADLLTAQGISKFWMVSNGAPGDLFAVDTHFASEYRVVLMDKIEGAIEKGGNLYLYQVSKRTVGE